MATLNCLAWARLAALLVLTGAIAWALSASAQVLRCTDAATGRVTYTDGDCPRGEAQLQLQPRQSLEDIERERAQAVEALARRHERQQQDAALQALRAPAEAAPSAMRPPDPASSPACQRARAQLQEVLADSGRGLYDEQARVSAAREQVDLACLTAAEFARTRRTPDRAAWPAAGALPVIVVPAPPRPHPPPPRPREISHCNVFRCYDRQGNTYPR
ncbi:protein of unknown function [Oryzisolibacter propanilivorax]|uniref:DUF4124 domain-containing protein n=1 Tax=Oryzisolibacter propanilivorax TaxID=1527607 RepID=A0A1G9TZ44_9BURK|nr:DUF4124 domain-containing protein [Oryzisolibacter propanilivorax]SDM53017.1 protein of unknown function [Oryzisolibacter propanilivorax]